MINTDCSKWSYQVLAHKTSISKHLCQIWQRGSLWPSTGEPRMRQLPVIQAKQTTQICPRAPLQRRLLHAPQGLNCLGKWTLLWALSSRQSTLREVWIAETKGLHWGRANSSLACICMDNSLHVSFLGALSSTLISEVSHFSLLLLIIQEAT